MINIKIEELWDKAKNRDFNVREQLAESLQKAKATKDRIELLSYLLNDKNSFVRSAALKSLVLVGKKEHFRKAVPLLNDKDEVVRVDAVECVAALGKKDGLTYLGKCIDDKSAIVRMYIGTCIGEIGNRSYVKKLEKRLEIERAPLAKVGLLDGIYLLGKKEKLFELLSLLNHSSYRVRCAVVNSVSERVNQKNKKLIQERFREKLKNETVVSVISTIEKNLKLIKRNR